MPSFIKELFDKPLEEREKSMLYKIMAPETPVGKVIARVGSSRNLRKNKMTREERRRKVMSASLAEIPQIKKPLKKLSVDLGDNFLNQFDKFIISNELRKMSK